MRYRNRLTLERFSVTCSGPRLARPSLDHRHLRPREARAATLW